MARYLVTGANGGMGRAICRRLFDRGDEPIGIDLKQADEGTPWRVIAADVTDPAYGTPEIEVKLERIEK